MAHPNSLPRRHTAAKASPPDALPRDGGPTHRLFLFLALAAPPLATISPRGMAPLAIAGAIFAALFFRSEAGEWPRPERFWTVLTGAFLALATVSAAWAPDQQAAFVQAFQLFHTLVPALLLATTAHGLDVPPLDRRRGSWVVVAFGIGLVLLAIDLFLGMPIYNLVRGQLLEPEAKPLSELNRNFVALAALVWPAMLVPWQWGHRWAACLLPLALLALAVISDSQSAVLGLLAGLTVLAVASRWPRLAAGLLAGATLAAFLLIVPATQIIEHLPNATTDALPLSFQHRIEIWAFTAERILDRPILGWGLEASRVLGEGTVSQIVDGNSALMPLHPHDAYLQLWLELGLFGAALAAVACLRLLRAALSLSAGASAPALAAYGSVLAMSAVAYGVWQTWWIGTMILALTLILLAAPARAGQDRP